ncbi:hypothetical protein JTE90_029534 [Oedothorax gibbosus]|uniref:Uncharacterized protein n=1 Tax=Oedothorax gibbosus TaxID=931172 RepID=A0AAV6VAK3_9ARAC|nr:hypothetical protein JTE90_029534 [Oedothorax gibbosus]
MYIPLKYFPTTHQGVTVHPTANKSMPLLQVNFPFRDVVHQTKRSVREPPPPIRHLSPSQSTLNRFDMADFGLKRIKTSVSDSPYRLLHEKI